MEVKINPKGVGVFVLISYFPDTKLVSVLGIYDTYEEALGCAYGDLIGTKEDLLGGDASDTAVFTAPIDMEGGDNFMVQLIDKNTGYIHEEVWFLIYRQ